MFGRDKEPGEPTVRVSVDADVAVRPLLLRDPVVDDPRDVLARALAEEIERSGATARAAQRDPDDDVVRLPDEGIVVRIGGAPIALGLDESGVAVAGHV